MNNLTSTTKRKILRDARILQDRVEPIFDDGNGLAYVRMRDGMCAGRQFWVNLADLQHKEPSPK